MKTLPDLQAWAIFATVAETGSFAQAAEVLGLSQPTVSKAIARLEKQLNISLFHRTSRRLSLTETGLASLEQAQTVLAAGQGAEALARDQWESLQGRIKIAAPMSFGLEHLAPLLPAFMKQHPAVLLDLHFNDAQVNIVEQGFDMALRISTMDDSSLLVRRLCNLRLRLVAAPAYLANYGRPAHPSDLARHSSLRYAYERRGSVWRFQQGAEHYSQTVPCRLQVNNAQALMAPLLQGLGLAVLPQFLLGDLVEQGLLEVVLPQWDLPSLTLHLLTPPGRSRPARVQAFIDFLVASFERAPWAEDSP
ncbi:MULTISPECIES: LysR family transcriptional regulator [Alcaligenes]|jgi:DNA-binding transcriptional LysR family regulator|uniref:LysR family transcriptional regulator n=1 Tax=unclassified Alcaligenes TaxID=259357 RepID=UPI000269E13D|nr:LysR family transcriptional regulator [Alcaligenes faecalis subsp. faecalis NCIB 8687]WGQ34916.1 LysR family transcriptional regulator [Alcaligenes faecalis]